MIRYRCTAYIWLGIGTDWMDYSTKPSWGQGPTLCLSFVDLLNSAAPARFVSRKSTVSAGQLYYDRQDHVHLSIDHPHGPEEHVINMFADVSQPCGCDSAVYVAAIVATTQHCHHLRLPQVGNSSQVLHNCMLTLLSSNTVTGTSPWATPCGGYNPVGPVHCMCCSRVYPEPLSGSSWLFHLNS